MRTLEELNSIDDGGSFDRLVKKVEEVANGDESLKQELLTKVVLRSFIQKAQKSLAVEEKQSNLDDPLGSNPTCIPRKFKDRIERLNGTNITLVIQKELTRTDMDDGQARFSMPRQQVRTHGFLSEEETYILSQKGIQCTLIQPCLETIDFELKKWKMGKTFSYALIKNWNSVASNPRNHLEIGSKVQLWSFRVESRLWFALVKLKETFSNGGGVTSV